MTPARARRGTSPLRGNEATRMPLYRNAATDRCEPCKRNPDSAVLHRGRYGTNRVRRVRYCHRATSHDDGSSMSMQSEGKDAKGRNDHQSTRDGTGSTGNIGAVDGAAAGQGSQQSPAGATTCSQMTPLARRLIERPAAAARATRSGPGWKERQAQRRCGRQSAVRPAGRNATQPDRRRPVRPGHRAACALSVLC